MTRKLVLPCNVRLFRPIAPGATNLRYEREYLEKGVVVAVEDKFVIVGWDHNANLAFKVEGKELYIIVEEVDDHAWQPVAEWMQAYMRNNTEALALHQKRVYDVVSRHLKPDLKVI